VDACPDTPAGDLVDASGCSVCPCGNAWRSRAAYVRCVRAEARRRFFQGILGRSEERSAVAAARKASCGRPEATRCCVYTGPDDASGRCRIMHVAPCEALADSADAGAGSCVPSPCAR
jgi:hypothetical protein